MERERIIRTAQTLGILFLLLGHSLSDDFVVIVNKTSIHNEGFVIIQNDSCLRDLKYRIKQPTHNFTVTLVYDGEKIEDYQNNSAQLDRGLYEFKMNTESVKKGTIIRLTVFGSGSTVKLIFKTKNKETCTSDISTTTVRTTLVYPTTIGQQHQPQKEKDYRNWFILLLLLVLIVAAIVTVKYRKKILTMYREKVGDHHDVKVSTVIHERNVTPTQFSNVNGQPVIDQTSSLLKNTSIDLCINDEDYAELRTSDVNYAVPDIRGSQASLCSFASFEDESTTTDDGKYHQPRHYSMSALNQQHYAQPGSNNNISRRSTNTLPVYSAQDYMSMGGSFPSINHYDQPSSNHSLSAENGSSSVKNQFAKDQEDYVAMFTQEENYSNIGRKPGESFRDKKYVKKNRHKNDEK